MSPNGKPQTLPPPALAHVAEDGRVHPLADHLVGTAERAAQFAGAFGCSGWGYLAGLWHDLGKYSAAFQGEVWPGVESFITAGGSRASQR
ncbi:MAG: hypothetical protein SCH98_17750 [Deferrisomatales bacterium]|nr:hypothetical protein [Deferrisomatales bacterium]